MPTPFPFNQVSIPPVLIAERILPVINNVIQGLSEQSALINNIVETMPTRVDCNDANIRELRTRLELLLNLINSVNDIIPIFNTVIDILRILANIGRTAAIAATIITPINGAAATAGQAASELSTNALTVVNLLKLTLTRLANLFPTLLLSIKNADQLLNDICNQTSDNTLSVINSLSASPNITISFSQFETADDLLAQYPSVFYTNLNVSDSDLNKRYQEIVKLLNDGFDVFNNLNEIPSQVIRNEGIPSNDIGTAGDFYINIETNQLFGPKPTNESWI